jgi:hypothetical protein
MKKLLTNRLLLACIAVASFVAAVVTARWAS